MKDNKPNDNAQYYPVYFVLAGLAVLALASMISYGLPYLTIVFSWIANNLIK